MIALGAGIANALGAAASNSSTAGIVGINKPRFEQFLPQQCVHWRHGHGRHRQLLCLQWVAEYDQPLVQGQYFLQRPHQQRRHRQALRHQDQRYRSNPTGLTINNNVYFANGSDGVFGFFNSLDVANLAAWKTAVGQDALSFESNPQYNDPTNATPDLHLAQPLRRLRRERRRCRRGQRLRRPNPCNPHPVDMARTPATLLASTSARRPLPTRPWATPA